MLLGMQSSRVFSSVHRVTLPLDPVLDDYSLDAGDANLNERIHRPGLLGFSGGPPSWPSDRAIFQVRSEGFIPMYGGRLVDDATDALKSFCGIGIALRLFKVDHKYEPAGALQHWYIHKFGTHWAVEQKLSIAQEFAKALRSLAPLREPIDDEVKNWIVNAANGVRVVFDSGDRGRNLMLAGRWLFEGHTGHDDMLNFVQCIIVMEILLGDGSRTSEASLSAILSSRLAYAIAETRQERENIETEFRELYAVRGKIVHRGHSRLVGSERAHLRSLRDLCARLIRHEVTLLQSELQAKEAPPA